MIRSKKFTSRKMTITEVIKKGWHLEQMFHVGNMVCFHVSDEYWAWAGITKPYSRNSRVVKKYWDNE